MKNFIYSDLLELSIIEYRLNTIFNILEKNNLLIYSPSLIFNETFWRLPFHERENLLIDLKIEWVGLNPNLSNIFSLNYEDIEIIRALKNTYFNYTKIAHNDLVNLLTSDKKNQVTTFKSFGEDENISNLMNELKIRDKKFDYVNTNTNIFLGENLFYNLPITQGKKVKILTISYLPSLDLWNKFIRECFKKSDFNLELLIVSKYSYNYVKKNIHNYKFLKKATKLDKFKIKFLNIKNLSTYYQDSRTYDFVFLDNLLSLLPSEIIQKYQNEYYVRQMRMLCNPKLSTEEVEKFKNIINSDQEIYLDNFLDNFVYDFIWSKYNNNEITQILTSKNLTNEYITTTLPLKSIELTRNIIKKVGNTGLIYIIDYIDKLGINFLTKLDANNLERLPVNFKIYQRILEDISDIKLETIEICNFVFDTKNREQEGNNLINCLNLEILLQIIIDNKEIAKKFFEYDLFEFNEKLEEIEKKYKYFTIFRKKKIFLFGLGSLLYILGFRKYILEVENILKYYEPKVNIKKIKIKWFDSYKRELLFEIFPSVINYMKKESQMPIIINDQEKKQKYLKKILKKLKIDYKKFIRFLNENKEIINELKKNQLIEYKIITLRNH